MNGAGWIVAIDFGTAFSKAAAVPDNLSIEEARRQVRALALGAQCAAANPLLAPSILFLENGEVFFGSLAQTRASATETPRREPLQSFKVMLGAGDLQQAMASRPSRIIDPDGTFTYRELIILYLAFLLGLVDKAFNPIAPEGAAAEAQLRYTRPGWYGDRTASDHAFIRDLFAQARGALKFLGQGFWHDPLSYDRARAALAVDPAPVFVDGGLFEATAVAVCHLPNPLTSIERLMVMDIGAGTSDFGGYTASPGTAPMTEIPSARFVLTVAGDTVDRALMDALLTKAKHVRQPNLQAAFWRSLLTVIRAQKETLFDLGKMAVRFEGKPVVITVKELERTAMYKEAVNALSDAFDRTLEATAAEALAHEAKSMNVVLAGGGAGLPIATELVRKAKPARGKVQANLLPIVPAWANDPVFAGALVPTFQQLAIALGAALAPREILIAGGVRF